MSEDEIIPDQILRNEYLAMDIVLQLTLVQKDIFKRDAGDYTESPGFSKHLERLTPALEALHGGQGKKYFEAEIQKFYDDIKGFIEKAKKDEATLSSICTYL